MGLFTGIKNNLAAVARDPNIHHVIATLSKQHNWVDESSAIMHSLYSGCVQLLLGLEMIASMGHNFRYCCHQLFDWAG